MNYGKLIAVEGVDGSGKSTLVRRLHAKMLKHNLPVHATKEPGGTPIGKHFVELLSCDKKKISPLSEFFLFSADRAHHFQTVVVPTLKKGHYVLSDRMADSSLAYQGFGRGLDIDMIRQVNAWAMQGVEPDCVLYVDIDLETAMQRIASRNIKLTTFEQEKQVFWLKVKQGFAMILKDRPNVFTLDGRLSEADLCQQAFDILRKHHIIDG